MSRRVYISADYSEANGDRDVINVLHSWGSDNLHKVDFVDTAEVVSGSVAWDPDCRVCDLKQEFNRQINASSSVIIVVGDRTKWREAGNGCRRSSEDWWNCRCTPYKHNANGSTFCKYHDLPYDFDRNGDANPVNGWSYLRHEYEQAHLKGKHIIVVYNALYREPDWLPWYMKSCEPYARPFWRYDSLGNRVGDYYLIKEALGF